MESKKRNITIAIMVAMFLGAVEGTVVTTAMPTIVRELQGFPFYGERLAAVISAFITLVSCLILPVLGLKSSLFMIVIITSIMGIGLGGGFTTMTIVIQESVGYHQRGAATAFLSLIRTLGQTIGVSIFGAVFNLKIVEYFKQLGINDINPSNLYGQGNQGAGVDLNMVREALNFSLHQVYIVIILLSVVSLILAFPLPSSLKKKSVAKGQQ